jgi:hypothetical protein
MNGWMDGWIAGWLGGGWVIDGWLGCLMPFLLLADFVVAKCLKWQLRRRFVDQSISNSIWHS